MVSTHLTTRRSSSVLATVALTASLIALASGAFAPQAALAQTTVDYGNMGTTTFAGTLSSGGITVTSPGVITVTQFDGLGIQGASNEVIDRGEMATFTFTGAATDVTVQPTKIDGSNGSATTIEAFGLGNTSLGVFTYYAPGNNAFFTSPSLSARVNNAPITSFRIIGGSNSGANVRTITFNGVTPPTGVPEPSEWAVIGMTATTLGGLMVRARRRKNGVAANG